MYGRYHLGDRARVSILHTLETTRAHPRPPPAGVRASEGDEGRRGRGEPRSGHPGENGESEECWPVVHPNLLVFYSYY